MLKFLVFLLLTALPGWKLDGLEVGQPAPSGVSPHKAQIKDGKIVTLWGSRLLTPEGATVRLGQSGESALKILGKTDKVLYGCGKDGGQQVHFFERYHLDLTVTNGKVTGLRLY